MEMQELMMDLEEMLLELDDIPKDMTIETLADNMWGRLVLLIETLEEEGITNK
jgi:hypothetical protein